MVNMLFILLALVLFTIGFRLVKRGRPHTRTGGDLYTRRRMRRMLGWMMWTTAAVLVMLTIVDQLSSGPPDVAGAPPVAIKTDAAQIHTGNFTPQFTPSLLANPALQANASGGSATNASPAELSLTSIPMQKHARSMMPNLMRSLSDDSSGSGNGTGGTFAPAAAAPPPPPPAPNIMPAHSPAADLAADPTGQKALNNINDRVALDPTNVSLYIQRANVYGVLKKWDLARDDFQHALRINSTCVPAQFGIAEVNFMQGHYADARPGYVALEQNIDYSDISKYKVFLCDLYGGHEDTAARELSVFNQVGSEASYYFANVAWSLYHKKPADAQTWWQSAVQIFSAEKVQVYAKPLFDLGYIKVAS